MSELNTEFVSLPPLFHYTSMNSQIDQTEKIEARLPTYPGNPEGVYLADLHPDQTNDDTLLTTFYNYEPSYDISKFRGRIQRAIEIKSEQVLKLNL